MEKPYWDGKEYSYFSHKKCEFFPCHKNADSEDFNCLFCYCPLYMLWARNAGEISVIQIRELKTVQTVCFRIKERIMDISLENIRNWLI